MEEIAIKKGQCFHIGHIVFIDKMMPKGKYLTLYKIHPLY
jgi:hypothetical protein